MSELYRDHPPTAGCSSASSGFLLLATTDIMRALLNTIAVIIDKAVLNNKLTKGI